MRHTGKTYADRILEILDPSGESMYIGDLREKILAQLGNPVGKLAIAANSGVSSALVNMRDRGQLRITGGGHGSSVKMIEIIPEFSVPNGRIVRLSDTRHWDDTPMRQYRGVSGSTLGNLSAAF